ncbi:MAG: hypothetical protein A3B68_06985 [Candidatus Melainabacteria bacterium RIFCSPHIGHO2_02_FULL_34_12]|nr:MAG: hypothetical protein A3B68_06985 [Candidatus Melainabacteria bacterium RIFCSPHIGHO2_02_FULL_34_12]
MFQGLLNAILGSATSTINSYPTGNGANSPSIPIGQTFNKFFSMLSNTTPFFGAFSGGGAGGPGGIVGIAGPAAGIGFPGAGIGIPGGGIPGAAGGFPQTTGFGAVNAYQNIQGQFIQGFPAATKHNKAQALAPGSAILSASGTLVPPQPGAFQGFTGQSGIYPQQFNPLNPSGAYGPNPYGNTQSGAFSKLQFLLGPIVGLFSALKSLVQLRGLGSMKPPTVNREDLSLAGYQRSVAEIKRAEGSFDEYYPETEEIQSGVDFARFQSF